eukprot:TRINITY_DN4781_c0_g1_i1.p1 TRINITY_DN4781_c0_g1~~TRINITY_DN4781_c0_g1_i1.p1  ORF type:complete len:398 (+),score=82.68 TRINITY_DN4781_c0_g1_i1:39-1232(+)
MSSNGKLIIHVISASGLLAKDLNGFSDPYVTWNIGDEVFKTTVKKVTLDPTWDETYVISSRFEDLPPSILFKVYDWDAVGDNDFIGQIEIPIAHGRYEDVHKLVDKPKKNKSKKKEKKRGTLHIAVEYLSLDSVLDNLIEPDFVIARGIARRVINDDVAEGLVTFSKKNGCHTELFQALISDEIKSTSQDTTLFRTDSVATKVMRQFSILLGHNWLRELVYDFVMEIINNPINYEINPVKLDASEDIDVNMRNIEDKSREILDRIMGNLDTCPNDLRRISAILKEEVTKKFNLQAANTSIASFIFLRFVCPSIITPDKMVGESVNISGDARKFLTTISKVVQNIANGVEFSKELYMIPLNDMVNEYIPRMQAFLNNLAVFWFILSLQTDRAEKYKSY